MDKIAIRNLLHNSKLESAVLKPLGYPQSTFKAICDVVEAAMLLEGTRFSKARALAVGNVNKSVRKLRKIK